jgi:hypothetical protein
LLSLPPTLKLELMMNFKPVRAGSFLKISALLLLLVAQPAFPVPTPQATAAFNNYAAKIEARLNRQHQSPSTFLDGVANDPRKQQQLRSGGLVIERLTPDPAADWPGALLHHWRGTAFIPGAKAAKFERILRDFDAYPQRFSPEVLRAKVLRSNGDALQTSMRIRQKHVLTVVMDTTYDVAFGQLDAQDGYSASRSTSIQEIDSPGSAKEHALAGKDEHGFLWRLNTYWSYQERDNGLYIQIESISMSRDIPAGLGWAIGPFVQSIPRESLEFTLRSASTALRN